MNSTEERKVSVPEGRSGSWTVERFTVDGKDVECLRLSMAGRSLPPGTYTRLMRGGSLVMSDTPAEWRDHIGPINRASKPEARTVLLHGLGIGMVLGAILRFPHITSVDVVEKSEDVLRLVGPTYASDARLSLHHGDAMTHPWPAGKRWDVVWHDIWDDICADNWPDIHRLHRRFGRRSGWQGSWSRAWMEAHGVRQ